MVYKHNKNNNKKKNTNIKIITSVLLVFIICVACVIGYFVVFAKDTVGKEITPDIPAPTSTPAPTVAPEKRVKFSASGDNLLHETIIIQAAKHAVNTDKKYDFDYVYQNIEGFLSKFDINFLNQETLVNDKFEPSGYPRFSSPTQVGTAMQDIGYNVFSLSNNHSYDLGGAGVTSTLEFWNSTPEDIVHTGFYSDETLYDIKTNTVNGITFSYLAYTDTTNGLPNPTQIDEYVIYSHQQEIIEKQIQKAKEVSDFVIVSMHWGVEYSLETSENQIELAQNLANYGADVIIGTHPHVIQPIEWVTAQDGTDTLCVYSLGNTVSSQDKPARMLGQILTFDAVINGDVKTIENAKSVPIVTHFERGYQNTTVYLLSDYTEELLNTHGLQANFPSFDSKYIMDTYKNTISPQFLVEDNLFSIN